MKPSKSLFLSKTFWLCVGQTAAPIFFPPAAAFVAAHPAVAAGLAAGVHVVNRVLGTSQPVDVLPR